MHVRATGNVEQRPVLRLLLALRAREVTGRVEVVDGAGLKSIVYLRRGRLVHIERPDSLDRLDHLLAAAGAVAPTAIAQAARIQTQTGRLFGDVLREMGALDPGTLDQALRAQLQRKLTRVFTPGKGTFEIIGGEHRYGAGGFSPGIDLDVRPLVYPGIRSTYDDERLSRELAPLAGVVARFAPTAVAELPLAGFPASDPLLASLAESGIKLDVGWLAGSREAKVTLLALFYMDLLVVDRPPALLPEPISARLTPQPGSLPLPRLTPQPGSVPSPRLTPQPVPVAPPSAAGSAAAEWRPVKSGTSWNTLDPVQLFKIADGHFRNGDFARAEEAFTALAKIEPKDLRHPAFLTWIRFWKPGAARDPGVEASALKVFKDAVAADNNFAYGYHFIGGMMKLRNDMPAAEKNYRTALRLDENLFESQRELRLIVMRKSKR